MNYGHKIRDTFALYILCATTLESVSKSMFTRLSSFSHCITCKSPKASPMSTSSEGVSQVVRPATKFTIVSLMQAPKPILLKELEKDVWTLHLNLPTLGFVHQNVSWGVMLLLLRGLFSCTFIQLLKKASARSPIFWIVSATLFQFFLFWCFQILHKVTTQICFWGTSRCWSKEKTISAEEEAGVWTCWI